MDGVHESEVRGAVSGFLTEETGHSPGPQDSLIGGGVVDSAVILDLVAFVEGRFGIVVEDEEILPDNFETVARIGEFVAAKAQG